MNGSLRGPASVAVALLLSLCAPLGLRAAPGEPAPPEPAAAPAAPAATPEPAAEPAVPALPAAPTAESVPAAVPAPVDPDAAYHAHCARVPADCGTLDGLVRLVETAPDASVRATALRELARRASPDAVPLALGLARLDPDPAVRLTAVLVLAPKIGDDTVARAVGRVAANDADPSVVAAARAALAATPASAPQEPTKPTASRWRKADPAAARLIYTPTAFTLPKRTWAATSYDIGHWSLAVGVHDNVELTFQTSIPVMFVHLGPGVKVSYPVSDLVRIGAWLNTQFLIPYIEDVNDAFVIAVGGGPLVSVGNRDMAFNVGVMSYGLWVGEDFHSVYVIDPTIGGSIRVSKRVKLNLELHVPLLGAEGNFWDEEAGKIWALLYGVRIFGDRLYGDVAFVWPIFEQCWEVMKYVPVGFPLLAFGFTW